MTDVLKESVYARFVSRDSVRLAFMLASFNNLKVLVGDVQKAYLNAPTEERCYCISGQEFGCNNVGRPVKIIRALYGLRSSGARLRDHMAATLLELRFKNCLADLNVYLWPNVKPCGTHY
jgi:Reverse transcriptase (RNA-dependent DNA polymerase)